MHPELTADQIDRASRYLTETRDALVETTTDLSPSQWDYKPAPDRWSIAEIVEHVTLVETRIHAIVERMSDAPEPAPGWEPAAVDDFIIAQVPDRSSKSQAPGPICPTQRWSGPEALEQFLEKREQTTRLLASSPLRGRVLPHPVLGPWDGYQWLLAAAAHSARHTEQIREVKACQHFPEVTCATSC
jgi:DinB superfamily